MREIHTDKRFRVDVYEDGKCRGSIGDDKLEIDRKAGDLESSTGSVQKVSINSAGENVILGQDE